ncbi:MAG: hypothetical protein NT049_03645, partial [Planctomycetota bacterium]|nr:hypothetical protein [Planctomycetota bacterium]
MTVSHWKKLAFAACLSLAALPPAGCIQPARSTDQLAEFEQATSLQIVVDMDSLRKGSISCDPYKVVSDDVLEIYMPLVLADAAEMDRDKAKPVLCRVGADGAVGLPIAGRLQVAGKTFAQI